MHMQVCCYCALVPLRWNAAQAPIPGTHWVQPMGCLARHPPSNLILAELVSEIQRTALLPVKFPCYECVWCFGLTVCLSFCWTPADHFSRIEVIPAALGLQQER
jgi:hypothetical protein